MKTLRKSKGERLNWTPLKEVKPVKITAEHLKGEKVVIEKTFSKKVVIE